MRRASRLGKMMDRRTEVRLARTEQRWQFLLRSSFPVTKYLVGGYGQICRDRRGQRGMIGMLALVLAASAMGAICESQTTVRSHSVVRHNVSWDSLGKDERDSMPLGNGDLAANVWTEQDGDLVLLVAKSDAYTEMGKLVKLGRVRLHFVPQLFSANQTFSQTLRLDRGD